MPLLVTRRAVLRFAAIFAAWTALGLLSAAQTHLQLSVRHETRPAWTILGPALIGFWIWALYTPPLAFVARGLRRLREHGTNRWDAWGLFLVAHLAVVWVVCVVDAVVWANVRPLIDGVVMPVERAFAALLLTNVVAYIMVVTLTEAADYAARSGEREREAAALAHTADTLRRQLDEARLRTLETQLRPHFLYNTLNLAAELVYDEPEAADEMLTHLGALLRRSYRESAEIVPLREEIHFVRAYAEILARRYRDRVRLTFDVPGDLEDQPVPAFVLQPLVENAYRHGVERREHASAVEVGATHDGESLVVRVRDRALSSERRRTGHVAADHVHTSLDPTSHASGGIGLKTTRERLMLLYGDAAGLTLARSAGETVASVWVPLGAPLDERRDQANELAPDRVAVGAMEGM
jgi:two-component system, LytTR family, sensor kinase